MPISMLAQCILGRGFAQISIGEVARARGRTRTLRRTCDLLIRDLKDRVLGRSLKNRNRLSRRVFDDLHHSVFALIPIR
jgi:hypothetical protein